MENKELVIEKTKELLATNAWQGLKDAAEKWLASVGTDGEAEATKAYAAVLDDSICTIDEVIDLFASDALAGKMPGEMIKAIHDHAVEVKAAGGTICDCPACSKADEVRKLL